MAFSGNRVTVGTSPTLLNVAPASAGYKGSYSLLVVNRHASASVFLGGAAVTAGDGFELLAGEAMNADSESGESLYGIVATGSARVDVLESGV